jgi:hypothetical protein
MRGFLREKLIFKWKIRFQIGGEYFGKMAIVRDLHRKAG